MSAIGRAAAAVAAGLMLGAGPADAQAPGTAVRSTLTVPDGAARWAYPIRRAAVRAQPRTEARVVGRLRLLTEDGLAETYQLIERYQEIGLEDWVRVPLPGRPNGRTGWVRRDAFDRIRRTELSVVVDRAARRLFIRRRGIVLESMRIGVGKRSTPTPAGSFYIREKFRVTERGTIYGPRALGTSAYAPGLTDWPKGGVVGFHGTNRPGLIPGNPSNGCIRLRNRDVLRFYRLVGVGTPVRIV